MGRGFIHICKFSKLTGYTADFIAATGITDATIISALTTLESDLTAAGIIDYSNPSLNKIKALHPLVGGTAGTHKYNFLDPRDLDAAFRLTFYGGWTHDANGVTGNGINSYADIHLNPFANFTTDSYHYGVYVRLDINALECIYGNYNGSTGDNLFPRYFGDLYSRLSDNDSSITTNSDASGYYLGVRNSSTNKNIYKNNTKTSKTSTRFGFANMNIYLGSYNYSGTLGAVSSNNIAFFHAGSVLDDTEAGNLYTAIQTFQTALGRQV